MAASKGKATGWRQAALWLALAAGLFAACGSEDAKKKRPNVPFPGAAGEGGAVAGEGPLPIAGTGTLPEVGGGAGGDPSAGAGGLAAELGGAGGQLGETLGGAGAGGVADGGSGGAETVRVFETITALYDAIESAVLAEGDGWRVEWLADARVAAGSIAGDLVQGVPEPHVLDQGVLPLKLFEARPLHALSW